MTSTREDDGAIAMVIGPAVAIGVAGLLAEFRDDVGPANVALVLACVVAAALAGRIAGVVTAIVAAVAYNFFHTMPYRSLRISAGRDVATVAMLVAIGFVVSELSARRRRASAASRSRLHLARTLESTAARLAAGAGPDEIWVDIHDGLVDTLQLADCRYESGEIAPAPLLPRSGVLTTSSMRFGRGGFELPATGVSIPVVYRGRTLGHITLVPHADAGSSIDARQAAIALADQFAVALITTGSRD